MVRKVGTVLGLMMLLLSDPSPADPRYTVLDEPVYIVVHNDRHGEHMCSIDMHLWVSGSQKEWCVKKLESAAHVARFEMQVR